MSRHERRYQKYLDRHRQKQANKTTGPGEARATAPQIATAANAPIHECLVPAGLFELGMGNLFFSRSLPDGRIALAGFLLDVFCLGVKNAFVALVARDEYARRMSARSADESLQPMQPACFRKLVEGGVAYAHDLGFNPHVDYEAARLIFGDVQISACPTRFEYGHDGKPFYISGPHETAADVQAIVDKLQRRLGTGDFDYLVLAQ
ncbi:MAG: hypothetical protein ACLQVM_28610 [Terriglobia bacterium]